MSSARYGEMDESMAVAKLTRKLQRELCPVSSTHHNRDEEEEELTRYALQILYSLDPPGGSGGRPATSASSVHHALDKVEAKLYQYYGSENSKIHQFHGLRNRFLKSPVFEHKTAILECLLNLAFTKHDIPAPKSTKPHVNQSKNGQSDYRTSAQRATSKQREGNVPNLTFSSQEAASARAPPRPPSNHSQGRYRPESRGDQSSTHDSQQSSFRSKSGMDNMLDRSLIAYSLDQQDGSHDARRRKLPFELSEQLLLRDLLYVFQGIDGKYIKFNTKTDRFELAVGSEDIPGNTKHLVGVLSEVGWLYKRASEAINSQMENIDTLGTTVQSFCSCLQMELDDFFRLLAVLESQLNVSAIHSVDSDEFSSSEVSRHARLVPNSLTLRRLFTWMQAPMQRLRNLCNIAESCRGLRGGALVSCLYDFARNGDPNVQTFVGRILKRTTYPLLGKLCRWILEGELSDERGDFFIACDESIGKDNLWNEKYSFRRSMLPKFVDAELARKVLLVGKSINFIRYSCEDTPWVLEMSNKLRSMYPEAAAIADGSPVNTTGSVVEEAKDAHSVKEQMSTTPGLDMLNKIRPMVAEAQRIANFRVMELVLNEHRLLEHLYAIKRYLLLGQGDFVTTLMGIIGPHLDKPAVDVASSYHTLVGMLEQSIQASNAQFDKEDILGRLHIKLYQESSGETGWDIFSLTYYVTAPLTAVLTNDAMATYARLFRFLWQLKRVEYLLSNTWCRHMTAAHALRHFSVLGRVLHQCHLLRSDMINFVLALSNYVMFEVLETSWQWLVNKIKGDDDAATAVALGRADMPTAAESGVEVSDIADGSKAKGASESPRSTTSANRGARGRGGDPHATSDTSKWWNRDLDLSGLIKAHEEYLARIMEKALLTGRSSHIGPHIQDLLDDAIRFARTQERLYTKALTIATRVQKEIKELKDQGYDYDAAERRAQQHCYREMASLANRYENEIAELVIVYRERMLKLLESLESGGEDLEEFRFLMFRFDFNMFYDNLHLQRVAGNEEEHDDT
eukprot:gb/GECG01009860.1/.p1 GENE.gb/GECG01009860.1/~~gb/GECG01009860.1/.p1  ORF type:complete len:1022 (+),score=109.43 gb/GECG01009860.1/:1-3066(+)